MYGEKCKEKRTQILASRSSTGGRSDANGSGSRSRIGRVFPILVELLHAHLRFSEFLLQ